MSCPQSAKQCWPIGLPACGSVQRRDHFCDCATAPRGPLIVRLAHNRRSVLIRSLDCGHRVFDGAWFTAWKSAG
jgi:hypothetical protein